MQASSLLGGHLVTTIDYRVQFLVQKLLADHVRRVEAETGQVIVMDVKTGDIIAMANYPYFDPNDYHEAPQPVLKNSCIVDVFEPGSIFKLVTYAAALEERVVTPGMILEIPETIVIQRRRIKEARPRKPEDPTHYEAKDILIKSMNVGTSMLAEKMGPAAFLNYIQLFGFGQRSMIELPGETSGLVRSLNQIAPIDKVVMSFGQGLSVTSIQMVAAAAVIGNGGMYVRPRIIKHQTDYNHLTISNLRTYRQHRVFLLKLRSMFVMRWKRLFKMAQDAMLKFMVIVWEVKLELHKNPLKMGWDMRRGHILLRFRIVTNSVASVCNFSGY